MFSKSIYLCATVIASLTFAGPRQATAANGETCQAPLTVTENTQVNGNLTSFDADTSIPAACIGQDASGVDVYYSFAANAGYRYQVAVKPGSKLDVAAALWGDCALDTNPCLDGSDAGGNGIQETLDFEPTEDRNYIIQIVGVDTVSGATSVNFSMKITGAAVPGDLGLADEAVAEDVIVTTDEGTVDDIVTGTDNGPLEDGIVATDEGRDGSVAADVIVGNDTAVTIDTNTPVDTIAAEDTGTEKASGGCGQGSSPSGFAVILLLAAFAVLIRRKAVF